MKNIVLVLFALSICLPVIAQQRVSGKVIDENGVPQEFVNVVCLALPDSTFVDGTVTDQSGSFSIVCKQSADLLKVSSVGFTTLYKPISEVDMGVLTIASDAQLLSEVVIKGDLPQTRLKGDVMVTNIQNSILSKAGSANDVLTKIPGLQGKDGNYTVFGKGAPLIYINGRQIRDLSELEQLHSSDIKSVELITNPGAQYNASVKSVVLIKTIKPAGEGLGFNVRTSQMYGEHYFGVNQLDFNYRRKGLDLFGSVFYSGGKDGTNISIDQQANVDTLWTQRSTAYRETKRDNYKTKIGLNYAFNDDHSVGVLYDFAYRTSDVPIYRMNSEILANDKLYDSWTSLNFIDNSSPVHLTNVYYNGNIKKLTVNFNTDMRWSYSKENQLTNEISENYNDRTVTTHSRFDNGLIASKLVLSYPVWKGSIVAGGEYAHTYQKNTFENREAILSDTDNKVEENNVSVFAEYRLNVGKLNARAGVRYEHNTSDYYEDRKLVEAQSKVYNNFFPSVSLSYPIGPVSTQLSYTIKTKRPSYSQLDGNMSYVNRFTYLSGNPLLKPTQLSDLTFVSSFKFLQFVASYQRANDAIVNVTNQFNDRPNISHTTYENFDKIDKLTLMLSASPKIGCWHINYSAGLIKQWFELMHLGEMKKMQRPMPYVSLFNTWVLPLDFQLNVDAVYYGKGNANNSLFYENKYVDVGVSKSFLKEKALTVKLECFDVFNSKRNDMILYGERNSIHEKDTWTDSRRVQLTLRYNFNVIKSKYKGTGAGESEKSRL